MLTPLSILLLLTAAPGGRVLVDRIVAVVNDDVIVASELDRRAEAAAGSLTKKQVLEQLINEQLMAQQIKEANIDVTDEEIRRAIADILRTNNITEAELVAAIEARGMTMDRYKVDLKSQLIRLKLIDQKVRSRVVIPESEIRAEYERKTRDESKEELINIRHIFLRWGSGANAKTRAQVTADAAAAKKRIENGEPFAEVAKAISQGPTASSGGDLGEMNRQQMIPELAKGIEGLEKGQLSDPIETDTGVHVVLLEGKRYKASATFAQSRNKIYQELYQREVEAQMDVWLDELRKQAAVTIRL